ncbi:MULTISPECIES: phosphotransferase family protein [Streptomyces]|uniref:Phosphotransferase enzyme family protein n=1 Tax=Streptomyces fradiae ATCC 10745 = DSM 40063 TaxID=1319510 RepID=A0A1Y2NQN3_STRFR|nr:MULTISPECIES: phosphotransferase [Streptomyces]OSY49357.1 Phosphotransferase enzyme family protein [Streptomyces fradiae ATCC 10745 = DSM 40063]QEV12314.1 aminoglycoside phosphotransferase family protein [Streptomyces fradiae ATCC 10745 = DSM 40063]
MNAQLVKPGEACGPLAPATGRWVGRYLARGERIARVVPLRGGWTSEMRRLDVVGPQGRRSLVLRQFVKPFFVRHAEGLLGREAEVLRLLGPTGVPAAEPVAVDPAGEHCAYPSLLMSLLPGAVRLDDEGAGARAPLLARQLAVIHRVAVAEAGKPRVYQAWTSPERVTPPAGTERPGLWARAVDVIRGEAPAYRGCFLHRDFHPGNVLFSGGGAPDGERGGAPDGGRGGAAAAGDGAARIGDAARSGAREAAAGDGALRVSGVVDWVETSWGPADLDVAHCSTALTLLHGVPAGMAFADLYAAAGGILAEDPAAHLYWRLVDALAYAPDAEKVAVPWRELGRTDLTPAVLAGRLEAYVQALLDRYGG